jgi:hypothetical protein
LKKKIAIIFEKKKNFSALHHIIGEDLAPDMPIEGDSHGLDVGVELKNFRGFCSELNLDLPIDFKL